MLALVNDVLDISTIEAGKRLLIMEPVNLRVVIEDCVGTFATMAEDKAITVEVNIAQDIPTLTADRRAVVQVALNLLSNAIKFTNPNGRVSVSVTQTGDTLSLMVEDTGVGISESALATVTEPFTRSHSNPHLSQTGTGLGLSIVKSLTEAHGGTLIIDSTPGEGTLVTARFPLNPGDGDQPPLRVASA